MLFLIGCLNIISDKFHKKDDLIIGTAAQKEEKGEMIVIKPTEKEHTGKDTERTNISRRNNLYSYTTITEKKDNTSYTLSNTNLPLISNRDPPGNSRKKYTAQGINNQPERYNTKDQIRNIREPKGKASPGESSCFKNNSTQNRNKRQKPKSRLFDPKSRSNRQRSRLVEPESNSNSPQSRLFEPKSRLVEPESRIVHYKSSSTQTRSKSQKPELKFFDPNRKVQKSKLSKRISAFSLETPNNSNISEPICNSADNPAAIQSFYLKHNGNRPTQRNKLFPTCKIFTTREIFPIVDLVAIRTENNPIRTEPTDQLKKEFTNQRMPPTLKSKIYKFPILFYHKLIDDQQIEQYEDLSFSSMTELFNTGVDNLKNTCLVILSGGEGSRFGYNGPKGCFHIEKLDMSILQTHFKRIREIEHQLNKKLTISPNSNYERVKNQQSSQSKLKQSNIKLIVIIMTSISTHDGVSDHIQKYNQAYCTCRREQGYNTSKKDPLKEDPSKPLNKDKVHQKNIKLSNNLNNNNPNNINNSKNNNINNPKKNPFSADTSVPSNQSNIDSVTYCQYSSNIPFLEKTPSKQDSYTHFEHLPSCPALNIILTTQKSVNCLDLNGLPININGYSPMCPKGNGAIFRTLSDTGALSFLRKKNIKYLNVVSVDNILANFLDPLAIGILKINNFEILSKAVEKRKEESAGTFINEKGLFCVKEYGESVKSRKTGCSPLKERDCQSIINSGPLKSSEYKEESRLANICHHYFTLKFIERVVHLDVPIHLAEKDIKILEVETEAGTDQSDKFTQLEQKNNLGESVRTTKSDTITTVRGYKPEYFIFDYFKYAHSSVVLLVDRSKEFSPIKNGSDSERDNLQTAVRDYLKWKSQKTNEFIF